VVLGLLSLAYLPLPVQALTIDQLQQLQNQAVVSEQKGDWARACKFYEAILNSRRDFPGIRERYFHCLRRSYQARRHQDASYHKEVLALPYSQAVQLYQFLVGRLMEDSVTPPHLSAERLYRKGLEEFGYALTDPTFARMHLPGISHADLRE